MLRNARAVDLPECGEDIFEVAPVEVQGAIAEFVA
jgi:hypothetical protein